MTTQDLFYNALSPKERDHIETAARFIELFDQLLDQSRLPNAASFLAELNKQAYELTMSLRAFKLSLLEKLLLGQVAIGLTPTFINHMVNELEEYAKNTDRAPRGQACSPLFAAAP